MGFPLVSIVIPCYNYAHFLADAIESALNQTYSNTEILVIDDGSKDKTAEVAAQYIGQIDYFYKSNGGLSQTRNYGARVCKGDYIVFLDADDTLEPTFIEECLAVFAKQPTIAFVYTQLCFSGNLNSITTHPAYNLEQLKIGNYINACSLLKRAIVRQYPYNESNRISWEDWDFYLTLAEHGYYGVLLDKPLVKYRRHDTNMTNYLTPLKKQRLRVSIMRRHINLVGLRTYINHHLHLYRLEFSYGIRKLQTMVKQPYNS